MSKLKLTDLKTDLKGIDFLRSLVDAFNSRDEHLNDNKTPIQLINEYLKYCNDEIDLDGNILIDEELQAYEIATKHSEGHHLECHCRYCSIF